MIEVVVQQAWAPPGIQGDQFDQHLTLSTSGAGCGVGDRRRPPVHPLASEGAGCTPLMCSVSVRGWRPGR